MTLHQLLAWHDDYLLGIQLCRVEAVSQGFAYWSCGPHGLVFTWVLTDKLS